ncbi:hypothetical protein HWV01_13105 [Moritella sp. 5]|uniref:P-loop NTPase fold protein n=1 Tax=Moritella sp. 5 TaxID=2746231 RepID=UPI001BA6731A|nr:P-loop NTPase fold protein [Moritella sp. 5]QUM81157.1 hypothetical protein HWV01_13105 [Moritella sp. 5]
MEVNKHTTENLDYYLKLTSPEYAFLLCGEWGVGKTHFIDKYIENQNSEELQLVKISLFGLKNISDVNSCIFQALHPVLGSKYSRLAGNILKGAISMGVKLDIDSDGTSESTLNTKLDKLNLSELFTTKKTKKTKEIVLVFDDLERTEISTVAILGFINGLVENSKVKVILISNEKTIVDSDDGKIYKNFKEKVIGKTFEIKHDFDVVLADFLKGCSLIGNEQVIKDVYKRSKLKNLRKFKQSINDFEYLINKIDDKYKDNEQFHLDLVRCFFALSIEVKKGSLSEDELRTNLPFTKGSDGNEIYMKYFSDQGRLYSGKIWANILFKGDLDEINEETAKLALFLNSEKVIPDWIKLWNFRELENIEFSRLISSLEVELKSFEENDLRIYLHKISLIIYFSKNDFTKLTISQIKKLVDKYIKKYEGSEAWKSISLSQNRRYDGTGYGYICEDDEDFIELKKLIIESNAKAFESGEKQKKKAEVESILYSLTSSDFELFAETISEKYRFQPIFNRIDPQSFVDSLLNSNNSSIAKVTEILLQRYDDNSTYNGVPICDCLKIEYGYWVNVEEMITTKLPNIQGLQSHLMKLFSTYTVKNIISLLEKYIVKGA